MMISDRILLVEDDHDIQENLRLFLETEGYLVSSAMNGKEAMDYLACGGQAQVILLDLMMPVMNGYEFLERIRSGMIPTHQTTPIILLSAAPDIEKVSQIRKLQFVKKPIELELLLSALAFYGVRPVASNSA